MFLISHFELFRLNQVFARMLGNMSSGPRFRTPLLYRYVRPPFYLVFLPAFWLYHRCPLDICGFRHQLLAIS